MMSTTERGSDGRVGAGALRALALVHAGHAAGLLFGFGGPAYGGALLLASLFAAAWPRRRPAWATLAALDLLGVLLFPLASANHHWVLGYVSAALALTLHEAGPRGSARALRGVVGVVMLFATAQKLLSPEFMSGRFFAFLLTTGEMFEPLVRALPVLDAALLDNHLRWSEAQGAGAPARAILLDWPPGQLYRLSVGLVVATLAAELGLAALALRSRRDRALPVALGLFVLPLVVLRPELTFAALLSALAAALAPSRARGVRTWLIGQSLLLTGASLLGWGRPS